jgi:hypothetical protein
MVSCVFVSFWLSTRAARIFATSRTESVDAIAYAETATEAMAGR